jgi:hypothetical protein
MVSFTNEAIFKFFGGNHFIIGCHQALEFLSFGLARHQDRRLVFDSRKSLRLYVPTGRFQFHVQPE